MNETMEKLKNIARFIKENFYAQKVILFGSYAYGEPTIDSDIDLFVLMETEKSFPLEGTRIRMLIEENFSISKPMDILVRSPEYIQKRLSMGDFFIRDVMEKGIEL